MNKPYDIALKILTVGDSSVGKTSLLMRYANETFSPTYITTIGIDFKIKYLDIDNKRIKMQLWDTAGQERFRSITKSYFRGSTGAIIMYDVTNAESFRHVCGWLEDLETANVKKDSIFLVANKVDIPNARVITTSEGEILATKYNIKYFESSARTGYGVDTIFQTIAKDISMRLLKMNPNENIKTTIKLNDSVNIQKKCCNL